MSATVAAPSVVTGRFVWRDVMSTDPEKAKVFYQALFGWTMDGRDMGGFTYEVLGNQGEDFGGLMPLDPTHGIPSNWVSYIHVPSVDDAVATAVEMGGKVVTEPMDIPGVGRFAVLQDPRGAHFSPFTSFPMEGGSGTDPGPQEMPPVGGVTWNELVTADVEGATAFYSAIFGWQPNAMNMMPDSQPYVVMNQGSRMDAGIMAKPAELPVSFWIIYFHVADLEQSLSEVARLGGQQVSPVIEVPTIGRMAWVNDPTGALFALHEGEK